MEKEVKSKFTNYILKAIRQWLSIDNNEINQNDDDERIIRENVFQFEVKIVEKYLIFSNVNK